MRDMLALARDAGCSALIFTVDMPVPGSRYRDYRSGLAGESRLSGNIRRVSQAMMRPRWAWDVGFGDQLDVLVDGGVYSGLDVVRMLALGAKSVLIGRSWVYGLAANGQAGVEHVLELIHKEMLVAMALTGCISLADIDSRVLDRS